MTERELGPNILPEHYTRTNIEGLFEINRPRFDDERGSFEEFWRLSEVQQAAGDKNITLRQGNYSKTNPEDNPILRGLHAEPQYKLVAPLTGRMLAVLVDLRKDSPTFLNKTIVEFDNTKEDKPIKVLQIPPGVGNSMLAFREKGDVGDGIVRYVYTVSEEYDPSTAGMGVKFDDVKLAIPWPEDLISDVVISKRDKDLPELNAFIKLYSNS